MSEYIEFLTLEEAAQVAGKTPHNIRDYIQRGRIFKYNAQGERITRARNGELRISRKELQDFLAVVSKDLAKHLSDDLHADLGFHDIAERERTKHVHRLHPYLGKFIPQLVEWFLARYFKADDVILDPFMGSGTTLVQGNEMQMHTIGIDISPFNCLIARAKTDEYDVAKVRCEILDAERRLRDFAAHFIDAPGTVRSLFDYGGFGELKERLLAECQSEYLRTWFAKRTLLEMLYYRSIIPDYEYQDLLSILLSRAVRSSRLIPHHNLATPKEPLPVGIEYSCRKHNRMCVPIEELLVKIHAYSEDTARRIEQFDKIRSNKSVTVIQGSSHKVNLIKELANTPIAGRQIDGIYTSPPYVGQIDYHEQHTYAYELLGFPRFDELEIGRKKRGKSKQAQNEYIDGIAAVFRNALPLLKADAKVFVVANDKLNLYPEIAKRSGMKIVERFERAVTKRTEAGDNPYQETVFLMVRESA